MIRATTKKTGWLAWLAVAAAATTGAHAAEAMYQPIQAYQGGPRGEAVIESMTVTTNGQTIIVGKGLLPPLTIQSTTNVNNPVWKTEARAYTREFTITNEADITSEAKVFRITGRVGNYAGSGPNSGCKFCHDVLNPGLHEDWMSTAHAGAFDTLKAIHVDKNAACLPCHTVGYGNKLDGQAGGFVSEEETPQFAGVQCENCHGPAGDHTEQPFDEVLQPLVSIAAESCGGCHTDAHHPTYDEWQESGHATITEEFGATQMWSCDACHSGAARLAMIKANEAGTTNVDWPTLEGANRYGITCVVCHNPHEASTEERPAQLRNPIASTAFFTYNSSAVSATNNLAKMYNPDIQICGQCHNSRGAAFNGTGRPPHHSPQYNILVGQVASPTSADGQAFNGMPGAHGDPSTNPQQCTKCHVRGNEVASPTEEDPNYTGHKFEVDLRACGDCHGFESEAIAEAGVEFIQLKTKEKMANVMSALTAWTLNTNKIPGIDTPGSVNYKAFYGTNDPANVVVWEFGTIGQLNTGKKAPPTAAQNRILTNAPGIIQARTLLYLVEHDASYGVHNVSYTGEMLDKALSIVNTMTNTIPAE